jgi:hypothetical protein
MTTNRRKLDRTKRPIITEQAVAAWKRADFMALHRALGLKLWETSPLPSEITALGCSEDELDPADHRYQYDVKALALQKQLLSAAGWPDCRQVYEENLRDAQEWAAYCRELVKYPDRGSIGTGCDPFSRREKLQEAKAEVAYRKKLLAELDEV